MIGTAMRGAARDIPGALNSRTFLVLIRRASSSSDVHLMVYF
jgi:hypothetical protein